MKFSFVMVSSANGKISRNETAQIDWNSKSDLQWFKEITMKLGVVVMGRKTFEVIGHPLVGRLNVVMSSRNFLTRRNGLVFVNGGPTEVKRTLESMQVKNAAVIGGKSVFTSFLRERLVSEMYVTYEPVLIKGIDMFEVDEDIGLETIEVKLLKSGAWVVHYAVKVGRKDERV